MLPAALGPGRPGVPSADRTCHAERNRPQRCVPCTGRSARTLSSWPEYRKSGEVPLMTALPIPAEDNDGPASPAGNIDSPPALLRLPKYYQVKKHLLDFTAAM